MNHRRIGSVVFSLLGVLALAACTGGSVTTQAHESGASSPAVVPTPSPTLSAPQLRSVEVTLRGTDAKFCYASDAGSACEGDVPSVSFRLTFHSNITIVAEATSQGSVSDASCTVVLDTGVTVIAKTTPGLRDANCDTTYAVPAS